MTFAFWESPDETPFLGTNFVCIVHVRSSTDANPDEVSRRVVAFGRLWALGSV